MYSSRNSPQDYKHKLFDSRHSDREKTQNLRSFIQNSNCGGFCFFKKFVTITMNVGDKLNISI